METPPKALINRHGLSTKDFLIVLVIIGGGIFISFLMLPEIRSVRPAGHRTTCKNNLKLIGLALHNYHDRYGSFPPAYIADENGKPMHSWRVLLLPFLDAEDVYQKYRFDEPWDGPNNRLLAKDIFRAKTDYGLLSVFNCPSETEPGTVMTNYVAVVGPETCWQGTDGVKLDDIKDGASNTLLVVEVANSGIHWMEPRDLHVGQMTPMINAKAGQGISSRHPGGAQVLRADGSVWFLSEKLPTATVRGLLTVQGGENINDSRDY